MRKDKDYMFNLLEQIRDETHENNIMLRKATKRFGVVDLCTLTGFAITDSMLRTSTLTEAKGRTSTYPIF